jgi:hypothetical protein
MDLVKRNCVLGTQGIFALLGASLRVHDIKAGALAYSRGYLLFQKAASSMSVVKKAVLEA